LKGHLIKVPGKILARELRTEHMAIKQQLSDIVTDYSQMLTLWKNISTWLQALWKYI